MENPETLANIGHTLDTGRRLKKYDQHGSHQQSGLNQVSSANFL